ncbi:hypothetical protein J5N97_026300 [Dioscorea zingiberensis]|uniref:Uncharacterized protein n=1 Tax=Dioscorea zingiberensis TaxID=325984 RepID=A0A9D5H6P2_9LILI|nr:hypothetical protein J5N97_026300 [Dioscorea zingiberensis]
MPCILWTSLGSRKYKILVGMERGQDPLPWNNGEMGEIAEDMEEETEASSKMDKTKENTKAAAKGNKHHDPRKKTMEQPETSLAGELRREGKTTRTGPASTQDRSVELRPPVGRTRTAAEKETCSTIIPSSVPRMPEHRGHVSQPQRPVKEKDMQPLIARDEGHATNREKRSERRLEPQLHADAFEPQKTNKGEWSLEREQHLTMVESGPEQHMHAKVVEPHACNPGGGAFFGGGPGQTGGSRNFPFFGNGPGGPYYNGITPGRDDAYGRTYPGYGANYPGINP